MIYVPEKNRISFNNILSTMMTIIILKIMRGSNDDENNSDMINKI